MPAFRRLLAFVSGALLALCAVAPAALRAQSTLTYDFEPPGQWTGNFRIIAAVGGTATGQTTVSGNGVFRQDSTSGSTAGGYLFDQTPADTTVGTQTTPNTGAEPGSTFSTVSVTLIVSGTTPTLVLS